MADEKQVFAFLVVFVILCFLIITTSNFLESVIDQTETTGSEVFRTQKYMAGTMYLYSQGESFGVYDDVGEPRDGLCDLDSELFERHSLGFDIRSDTIPAQCHDPEMRMASVMLNRYDTDRFNEMEPDTLEVGER